MCGIVAATGRGNAVPTLLAGLQKLEYRGYDSAGLAFCQTDKLNRLRTVGRVSALAAQAEGLVAHSGIAHTRWATHGVPSEANAHPHISGGLAVVHNGIIENFESLRLELSEAGYNFTSDTDSEIIAHLVQYQLQTQPQGEPDLLQAVRQAARRLIGAYAIAVLDECDPEKLVVARAGSPLLVSLVESGESAGAYAASDAAALVQLTRRMAYLENGDIAELQPQTYRVISADTGEAVQRPLQALQLDANDVELGEYQHYMQKEIFEQPQAIANTLELIGGSQNLQAGVFGADSNERFKQINSVLILACGTSYHAGLTVRYWIEALVNIPCTVEIASEYRYRVSVSSPTQLVIAISQSGETADTLTALRHAKLQGHEHTLALCNVPESSLVRECGLRFITRAGTEIGVASTKAFSTQLAGLFLLTLLLAKARGLLSKEHETQYLKELRHLPRAINKVLALEPEIVPWAECFAQKQHALFLGRGPHYPIALEGSLKLKEISYIHAEAYPAGELKHGPLALVDADIPVVSVAPNDRLLEKLKSNLSEVRARGGELYVFADADSHIGETEHLHILRLPEHYGLLSPILHVVPLQLLAYHTGLFKRTDVDKPRNLAKSVTVE